MHEWVTEKERVALDDFKYDCSNLEKAIKYYIDYSHIWKAEWLPLRQMGLEKFVRCLVNGYKVKFNPNLKHEIITEGRIICTGYGYSSQETMLKADNPIYIALRHKNGKYIDGEDLAISEVNKLIDNLNELTNHIKEIRSDI